MLPSVRLKAPDGREVDLSPGEIIGRLSSAALHLGDARVSEAHAMVSLRAGELVLLALRRRFVVDGLARSELVLEPGLELELGSSLTLLVLEVELPDHVLAVRAPGLPTTPLPPVTSLLGGAPPRVAPRFDGQARAVVFSEGARFLARVGAEEPREVGVGDAIEVDGVRFELVAVPRRASEVARTAVQTDAVPRTWVLRHDVVTVSRAGQEILDLRGYTAQIVSELAAIGQPAPWEVVARELWRDGADAHVLRRRWDMALGRLRHKLRDAELPTDLVRADGAGNVELRMRAADRIEDRS